MTSRSDSLRRARPSLGTLVDVRVSGAPQPVLAAGMAAAFAAIEQVHRLMTFHSPDSDLSRLNRQAARESVEVHAWTWQVLFAARSLWEHTGGLFDCSVAPALVRAGFCRERAIAGSRFGSPALLGANSWCVQTGQLAQDLLVALQFSAALDHRP